MIARCFSVSAARFARAAVCAIAVGSVATVVPQSAFAWGAVGHRLVALAAADVVTDGAEFWKNNQVSLETFANTPDAYWKSGASSSVEKPTHYFQFDFYSPDLKPLPTLFEAFDDVVKRYTQPVVDENGSAVWRVEQMFLLSREALSKGRYAEGLQWAGAMAHYVGDLSQPLHVTQNYDGQKSGQKGIHSWFETANIASADQGALEDSVVRGARALVDDASFRKGTEGGIVRVMLLESARSAAEISTVLETDARLGRSSQEGRTAQLAIAQRRLADGAATYALLLARLWREADMPSISDTLHPAQPSWRAPEYSRHVVTSPLSPVGFVSSANAQTGDCN